MSQRLGHRWLLIALTGMTLWGTALAASAQRVAPDLDWEPWLPEMPLVDFSGEWIFDVEASDPMIEEWADREIVYHVRQTISQIELEFAPADAASTRQVYVWDGTMSSRARSELEVRERAGWTDGGRVLRIEGRRWSVDQTTPIKYELRYEMRRGGGALELTQTDAYGSTVWVFRRSG